MNFKSIYMYQDIFCFTVEILQCSKFLLRLKEKRFKIIYFRRTYSICKTGIIFVGHPGLVIILFLALGLILSSSKRGSVRDWYQWGFRHWGPSPWAVEVEVFGFGNNIDSWIGPIPIFSGSGSIRVWYQSWLGHRGLRQWKWNCTGLVTMLIPQWKWICSCFNKNVDSCTGAHPQFQCK